MIYFPASTGIVVHVIDYRSGRSPYEWEHDAFGEGTTAARCLADNTGGTFTAAESPAALIEALENTLGCPLLGGAFESRRAG